jgi:hypothetical protein
VLLSQIRRAGCFPFLHDGVPLHLIINIGHHPVPPQMYVPTS